MGNIAVFWVLLNASHVEIKGRKGLFTYVGVSPIQIAVTWLWRYEPTIIEMGSDGFQVIRLTINDSRFWGLI